MATDTSKALLAQLVQLLTDKLPGLIAVYRFGSYGTDAMRPDSDIDLGLFAERPLDPVQLFDLAGELATLAHREVDLVDLITCSTVMRAQIIATGERLLCRDEFRCENFADTAFSRYAHLNEARRGILADIQTRGAVHGG
ncbi:MAG TPA: nucleotidyltransferase domain-containing protein [Gammaproteobacteria bacterium]|nr:nucleotidyltransferase domain-containing protein [Gammaproteobacteria bacterium]